MIRRSRRTVLLADHSKIGKASRVSVCRLDEIDVLVTDSAADLLDIEVVRP
jgi:DeoR/GlpR family transcriptional regulator of sugar metabolism